MKKNKIHFGFTLVEIIVVISILAVLVTISFISYKEYLTQSRDTNRVTSLSTISKGLKEYFFKNSKYPNPDGNIGIGTINGIELSKTGFIGEKITKAISMRNKPIDPFSGNEFRYGISYNNKNFQLAATTEGLLSSSIIPTTYAQGQNKAYVVGNYEGILKRNGILYNIPSMIYSGSKIGGKIDLTQSGTLFVVNKSTNVPYKLSESEESLPQSTSEILINILGSSTGSINSYDVNTLDWKTSSGAVSEALGYNSDTLGLFLYGQDFTPTLWVPPVKSTGSTNPTSPPPVTGNSGGVLFSLDFETNTGYTVTEGTFNRVIDPENGTYVIESGNRANSTKSCFEFNLTTTEQSEINFNYFVSSEDDYDYFEFYINGAIKKKLSGDLGWISFNNNTKPFSPGNYNLKFCYSKYASVISYDDKIMVDNIIIKTNNYVPPVFSGVNCNEMTQENITNLNNFFNSIPYPVVASGTYQVQRTQYCALTQLALNWKNIESVPQEIGFLTNLEVLNLNGNQISVLPSSITNLVNLITLDIGYNPIGELPSNIGNLQLLTELNAQGIGMTYIPTSISGLVNIQSIDFSQNSIETLPAEFFTLGTLNNISLTENLLTGFNVQENQFPNLFDLYLSRNSFEDIPGNITFLNSLENFEFAGNMFTTFPALPNLLYLDIGDAGITSIPENLFLSTNLETLYAYSNQIEVIPPEIGNLINIYEVDLSSNLISTLPPEIGNLVNLVDLNLSYNSLTTLPLDIVNLTNKLSSLNLSNNSGLGTLSTYHFGWGNKNVSQNFPGIGTFGIRGNNLSPYKIVITYTP